MHMITNPTVSGMTFQYKTSIIIIKMLMKNLTISILNWKAVLKDMPPPKEINTKGNQT